MISFFKKVFKVSVIGTVLVAATGVGAYALLGEGRTHAVMHEIHGNLIDQIDASVDDPTAMRAQLREMEQEYPKRIAQVRGDMAELEHEIRELEREIAISDRVVALADEDLGRLETQYATQVSSGENKLVAVQLDDRVYSLERASIRMKQIQNARVAHANRSADAQHDLGYLVKQKDRLDELLAKLEAERAEFKSQILGLSRQIDAIARNDRLINLLEKRNRTIEECSRYEAVSLEQITGNLAQIRSRQEAELDLLATAERETDYEDLARMQLAAEELAGERGDL